MDQERRYWEPEIETMPLHKLKEIQGKRLRNLVALAYEKTSLYQRKFDEAGVKPDDVKTIDDIVKLPITDDMTDVRDTPLSDRLAIPETEIERFNSTSGTTTGSPEPIPFNKKDTDTLLDSEAQGRWTVGVRPNDTAQILTNYDISEMGYNRLGSRFLLFSAGRYMPDKQIRINKTAEVTVLDHFPSQLNRFYMQAKEMGIIVKDLALRMIIGIGESIAESKKTKLEEVFGVPIMSLWGMMESGTMAAECQAREGMHIFSHRVILEVIDPETQESLPEGEEGELVITPLLYE
ncbi:MAG: AMP-binding protein, partial [Thermodesulfobacteriota bacterium]|nr:AMP-binding protein [Thermodesulfobacteriota bacterium]